MIATIDLMAPELRVDPYPTYRRLRRESAVFRSYIPLFGAVHLLTRHADVTAMFGDPRFVNDPRNARGARSHLDRWWAPRLLRSFQRNMAGCDEPDHRRLRAIVHKAFTPRRVETLRGSVDRTVGALLDAMADRPTVDLMTGLAIPLPLTIISEMMGVPEAERLAFHRRMTGLVDSIAAGKLGLLRKFPDAVMLLRCFRRLLRLRRERPGEDLLTALVQAEEQGDRLSEDELIAMVFLLLLAGHDTTVNLLGTGVLALLQNPDQLQRLRDEPALIGPAVEELLRFTSPVAQSEARYAREDIEVGGHVIPRGAVVLPLLASANRDEAAFDRADELDLTRQPNRHVAFGLGAHHCLGANLARMEARTALLALVQRFPRMRLAVPVEQLRWSATIGLHGLVALPLALT